MSRLEIDRDIIEKYNQAGPRYTSYPSANHFQEIGLDSSLLQARPEASAPLSLYFHLPFCETLCWFCGCNTITTTNKSLADTYIDYLEKELALSVKQQGSSQNVVQLHFGGGTPNFLTTNQLERLGKLIHQYYGFETGAEKSVELDPRRLSLEQVETFAKMGVNRASFGIQDCDPKVQKAIHRIQPKSMNVQTMRWLRAHDFESINVDLIYGLPGQSIESFEKTIDHVLSLNPDRIALFNYAHVPWMRPAQKLLERVGLPNQSLKLDLFTTCIERLTREGFVYIGMDHFARPDDELVQAQSHGTLQRNFQGYSTRAGVDIRAFGISSISSNAIGYYQNTKDLKAYQAALNEGHLPVCKGYILNTDDKIRKAVINRLMCDLRVDMKALSNQLGVRLNDYLWDSLQSLEDLESDGLIRRNPNGFDVTLLGRILIRNIAMRFDGKLAAGPHQAVHSRTI